MHLRRGIYGNVAARGVAAASGLGAATHQGSNNAAPTAGTEITITTLAEMTAGTVFGVFMHTKNATATLSSAAGGGGNMGAWSTPDTPLFFSTNRYLAFMRARATGTVPIGTVFTFTNTGSSLKAAIAFSASNSHADGIAAGSPGTLNTGSTAAISSSITPAFANGLLLGAVAVVDGTNGPLVEDAGWTLLAEREISATEGNLSVAWKLPGSTSPITKNDTQTPNINPWGARIVEIKAA